MTWTDERILILTSTQKDSESTFKLLEANRFHPYICQGFADLLKSIAQGAGALLLAKEVLVHANLDLLKEQLQAQESWSDLPIVILASAGDLTQGKAETFHVLKALRNATILERPVRITTLTSMLESAISNRRRQYEVRNLLKDLIEARKEAEFSKNESDRANHAKSEFLANMSHEIRTPLGVIIGFTDLAINETDSTKEENQSYLSAIHRNGQLLLALVNDILDLAKVESGRIETEFIDVSILGTINDVVAALRPTATRKGVEIIFDAPADVPAFGKTDPTRLRQIVMNVLGNAIKFTKQGKILLQLHWQPTHEGFFQVFLTVKDTGLGISEQQQTKLFQPFSQADSSMTREYGGTGLGLVLSKQLARVLGGDLRLLESTPNVGSTFEISFEAGVSAPDVRSLGGRLPKKIHPLEGVRILIVEDSFDNQQIVSRILKMAGASIELANDGVEAVERALAQDFDVILMDIQMPHMDGKEATRRLREQGYQKPIIALTANALKDEREESVRLGFDDYLTKPIQRGALLEALEKASESGIR